MWDETVAGPKPEHGLGRLRNKITAQPIDIKGTHIICIEHIYICLLSGSREVGAIYIVS